MKSPSVHRLRQLSRSVPALAIPGEKTRLPHGATPGKFKDWQSASCRGPAPTVLTEPAGSGLAAEHVTAPGFALQSARVRCVAGAFRRGSGRLGRRVRGGLEIGRAHV